MAPINPDPHIGEFQSRLNRTSLAHRVVRASTGPFIPTHTLSGADAWPMPARPGTATRHMAKLMLETCGPCPRIEHLTWRLLRPVAPTRSKRGAERRHGLIKLRPESCCLHPFALWLARSRTSA